LYIIFILYFSTQAIQSPKLNFLDVCRKYIFKASFKRLLDDFKTSYVSNLNFILSGNVLLRD